MRQIAIELANDLAQILNHLRLAERPSDDVTIKIAAMTLVIANFIVHCSPDKRHLRRSKRCVHEILDQHIEEAWQAKNTTHTEKDTSDMLRRIGILK